MAAAAPSDGSITPYKIDVPDAAIKSLKEKLAVSQVPSEVDFSNDWAYGSPRNDVLRLAKYWQDGFDWRAQEAALNASMPQFQTTVEVESFGELKIHFVHKESVRAGSIPLLFCHGWPGHFLEVAKILPLLTENTKGPSFHVVAPSLPNFGFSDGVKQRGFSIPQYAQVCHKLMLKLGYNKYVTQGGDWGFIITRLMGALYPGHVLASHINFIRARGPPQLTKNPLLYLQHKLLPLSAFEKRGRERSQWFQNEGYGYNVEQGTRPSTIGFALADPVSLLAWIYEKLHDWTDDYPWADDEILTWVSIYQFSTAGAAASARIYYESRHAGLDVTAKGFDYLADTALGTSYFPKDLSLPPFTWGRTLGPVVFEKAHDDGGHFAAYERPDKLVEDIRTMFEGGAKYVAEQFT
ncbi:Epoxide hydrolase [Moelleriella libera RCEF 2490]|uniref:Epoxide hydrolase n=1 Tax=Moelleriella libera RCEF 2490 TaxID=1081109 RepID=A0A167ZZF6_9HYPO|nr:Epoxide hydrolase [Moelleriella libera RCEF 2490]